MSDEAEDLDVDVVKAHQSDSGTVKIEGLTDFVRHMRELDAGLPEELRKALAADAFLVAGETTKLSPVGTEDERDKHPGMLAKSVRYGAKLGSSVTYGWVSTGGGKAGEYAGPIVYGWDKHDITANPFPYRALDSMSPLIFINAQEMLDRLIGEVYAGSEDL
jgi:hypothetical protein